MKNSLWILMLAAAWCGPLADARGQVNTEPLPLKAVRAFPELRFDRPIVVTHAGDGTNRVFVAEQRGKIQVFPNTPDAAEPQVFLDISERVVYQDKQNEEGFLGLAFHPDYKNNGEFFIYYTTTEEPQLSKISRFRVSKNDPNKADAEFEEEIMRVKQPFWNHNGGTIVFGPDGYLYIALGDGGSANDPMGNGQNLGTLLGSVLRIDVDNKDPGKGYAIPKDNPFVGKEGARGEIWAYGLRNIWRMSFDRETGALWAGEVGQNLWEEINIIVKGGNYGWNVREALHPFDPQNAKTVETSDPGREEAKKKYIDPIWEYHHDIGKSITGGHVYRGERLPRLNGAYIYADYVTGKIWALWYDMQKNQVTANREIASENFPVMSFGEDEHGEVYFTTTFGMLYTFDRQSDRVSN